MNPQITFTLFILAGIAFIYPLAPHFFAPYKKTVTLIGISFIHIGLYGILWNTIPLFTLLAVVLLELGLILFLDPFAIVSENNKHRINILALLAIVAGGIILLSNIALFPLWLWLIPAALFAISKTMSVLDSKRKIFSLLSILLAATYLGYIGYSIYNDVFRPSPKPEQIKQAPLVPDNIPNTDEKKIQQPTPQQGPLTSAIYEIDQKVQALEDENKKLKEENLKLQEENAQLKNQLNITSGSLKEQTQKIDEVKEAAGKL
ncbi:MAG TPA: hypothetical protein DDW49_01190 [Deltaproteobacteria bacterium]|nr:MAG: hypothetical protein A2048_08365 [Deltaproteobacteria bacterium GWA2_45_12]HBF11997.1 hypothetical protein [Deltaproteobacteria bacterium]